MRLVLLLLIAGAFLASFVPMAGAVNPFLVSYLLTPLLWAVVAAAAVVFARRDGLSIWSFTAVRRWSIGRQPWHAGLLLGSFHVACLVMAGLAFGFGRSPYAFSPAGLLINAASIVTFLLGMELSRAYFIKRGTGSRRNLTLSIGLAALLFTLVRLNLSQVLTLDGNLQVLKFVGGTLIPLLAMSLLASYLASVGGAKASLGYMGVVVGFEWFSPVLPDLPWLLAAVIGTLVPAVCFALVQGSLQTRADTKVVKRSARGASLGWMGVAIACTLVVFVSTGVFGVKPTVISSGSMQPSIDVGDVVFVTKTSPEALHVGDVIQYSTGAVPIVHRITDITANGGGWSCTTKGDANEHPDLVPVVSEQVLGKAVVTIPKVGYIAILFQELFHKVSHP